MNVDPSYLLCNILLDMAPRPLMPLLLLLLIVCHFGWSSYFINIFSKRRYIYVLLIEYRSLFEK